MGHPRSRNWTLDFEPAFSPRFSPTLSPRSFFPTGQRFPISLPVMTSLDQSGASITAQMGALYYSERSTLSQLIPKSGSLFLLPARRAEIIRILVVRGIVVVVVVAFFPHDLRQFG